MRIEPGFGRGGERRESIGFGGSGGIKGKIGGGGGPASGVVDLFKRCLRF